MKYSKLFLILMLLTIFFIRTLKVQALGPGVYYGAYTQNFSDLSSFESDAGKPVSLFMIFQSWNEGNFPGGQMEAVRSHGAIPVVSWDSYIPERPVDTSWKSIAAGSMDSYINQWANDAKNWGHPFFLRFDWEMNGFWVPYAKQSDSYVPMWKHVHDIFVKNQVNNVTWVWCPNIDSTSTQPLEPMYPGSAYVDWVCVDGYNFGTTQSWSSWVPFSPLFTPTYNHLGRLAPGKPIMIAEIGSTEQGGSKAAWIRDMLTQLPTSFPNIKALIWFNIDKETNWRIDSSDSSKQAFAQGISSSYFVSNQYAGITTNPIPYLGSLSANVATAPILIPAATKKPTPKPTPTPTLESSPSATVSPPISTSFRPTFWDFTSKSYGVLTGIIVLTLAVLGILFLNRKKSKPKRKK